MLVGLNLYRCYSTKQIGMVEQYRRSDDSILVVRYVVVVVINQVRNHCTFVNGLVPNAKHITIET